MRKTLLAATVAAVAISTTPAVAGPPAIIGTTCGLVAVAPLGSNTFTGVFFVADTGIDVLEPFENPMENVTVFCELIVNSSTVDTISNSMPIAAGGVKLTSFTLTPASIAYVCTTVSATDGDGEPNNRPRACQQVDVREVLPEELEDPLCPFLPPIVCTDPALVRVAVAVGLSI